MTALHLRAVERALDIAGDVWDGLANPEGARFDPFLSHAFFTALEESGSASRRTGWQPMHVIAETAAGEIVGILPLYLKGHSQGEYVFDHGWAQGFEHAGGRYYPKLLNAVPFTPVTGRRIFTKAQNLKSSNSATAKDNHSSSAHDARIQDALISHALSYLKAKQISSFHMNFIEPELAPALEGAGFLLRRDTQFHWVNNGYDNFDDFLETLQSRKRKALRKERRAALEGGICVEWVEGEKLTPKHWDQFYDFYLDTGERKWGRPYLNRRFFDMIHETLAAHIVLIFAVRDGRYIGGALNMKGSDTLYGRYWGSNCYVPFLHFEICYYQAIDYALKAGLSRVEAGAQGQHKLLRGYAPSSTLSAHYIAHPNFRQAVEAFLVEEGQHVRYLDTVLREHLPYKAGD